jgi:abortive infection bacteriophage resistance protein
MDMPDHFRSGLKFENIVEIYNNDQWLRNRLLMVLEPIEIHIKTRIAYHLSLTYGSDCFYQSRVYKSRHAYNLLLQNFNNEIDRNLRDPVIIHHQNKYAGNFPIWVVVEFLSFNTISKFFENMAERDKKHIANNSFGVNENFLGQW